MSLITVFVKNMAGDLLPVELPTGSSVEHLVKTLNGMDNSLYPPLRTHIYRSPTEEKEEKKEEKKEELEELEEGEVVSVFVSEEYAKTGFFEKDIPTNYYWRSEFKKGAPYTRFTVPIAKKTLYLYVVSINTSLAIGDLVIAGRPQERKLYFIASLTADLDTFSCGYCLYDIIKDIFHSIIVPVQMKTLYDIIHSHYTEVSNTTRLIYTQSYNKRENVKCECGAVIRRSCLPSHITTNTHQALIKTK